MAEGDSRDDGRERNRDGTDPSDRHDRQASHGDSPDAGTRGKAELHEGTVQTEHDTRGFWSKRDQVKVLGRPERPASELPDYEQQDGDDYPSGADRQEHQGKGLNSHGADERADGADPVRQEAAKPGANQARDAHGEEDDTYFSFHPRHDGGQIGGDIRIDNRKTNKHEERHAKGDRDPRILQEGKSLAQRDGRFTFHGRNRPCDSEDCQQTEEADDPKDRLPIICRCDNATDGDTEYKRGAKAHCDVGHRSALTSGRSQLRSYGIGGDDKDARSDPEYDARGHQEAETWKGECRNDAE